MKATLPEITYVTLKIIDRRYPRSGESRGDLNKFLEIYVPLSPIDQEPFVLGTGGFASVFLAFDQKNSRGEPLAVKLLRKEKGTGVQNGRQRFVEEIFYNQFLSGVAAATFVPYHGFGYLANTQDLTSVPYSDKEKQWVLAGISDSDLRIATSVNDVTSMRPEFLAEHQNLFFVMTSAWFSLDRLLVSNQPLHASNSLNLSFPLQEAVAVEGDRNNYKNATENRHIENTLYGDAHEQLKNTTPPNAILADTIKRLGVSELSSGLEILSKIRRDELLGPAIATKILLDVFIRLTGTVAAIHQARDSTIEGNLAHRDLKPANFLISECQDPTPTVLLSDLGFIAAEQNGKTMYNAFGRVAEPGVLPQGTVMFQAPEQMLSGREVSFELVSESAYGNEQKSLIETGALDEKDVKQIDSATLVEKEFLPDAIRIRTVGGIEIEPDDRILCDDIKLVDGGDGNRMLVRKVSRDPMYPTSIVAFIAQTIAPKQTTRTEYTGTLLKPVGQHSDIFSLGCHAYFIASGGKDPSEFYRTYLRPVTGLIYLDAGAPKTSCIEIARFLARRNGSNSDVGEMSALATAIGEGSTAAAFRALVSKGNKWAVSGTRDHFLFSTDGKPIGIIFLFIIVSLMCRRAKGSYVSGGPREGVDASTWKTKPLAELLDFLNAVVQQFQNKHHDIMAGDPFQRVWVNGLNILVKLRLLASSVEAAAQQPSSQGQSQLAAEG